MIVSLQGCMAVGKTTAVRYIEKHAPYVHISYEDNKAVIEEVVRRGLIKTNYEDYLEIQKLWLRNEVQRWEKSKEYPCTLMDFGAEEIEFYTLHYPKTIGENWEVEEPLREELEAVRRCYPDRILFLDASDEILRQRKEQDSTRSREFFEHHIQHLLPLKRQWFCQMDRTDVLNTDHLTSEEVGERVKQRIDTWMSQNTGEYNRRAHGKSGK